VIYTRVHENTRPSKRSIAVTVLDESHQAFEPRIDESAGTRVRYVGAHERDVQTWPVSSPRRTCIGPIGVTESTTTCALRRERPQSAIEEDDDAAGRLPGSIAMLPIALSRRRGLHPAGCVCASRAGCLHRRHSPAVAGTSARIRAPATQTTCPGCTSRHFGAYQDTPRVHITGFTAHITAQTCTRSRPSTASRPHKARISTS
jgi:hypothetical protein